MKIWSVILFVLFAFRLSVGSIGLRLDLRESVKLLLIDSSDMSEATDATDNSPVDDEKGNEKNIEWYNVNTANAITTEHSSWIAFKALSSFCVYDNPHYTLIAMEIQTPPPDYLRCV